MGELMGCHLAGDADAFPAIVRAFGDSVYGYLARCGVEPPERDDLFQEIFAKVHRAAGQYDVERPFRPWLFTIVANTVRNHLRGRRVRSVIALSPVVDETPSRRPDAQAELEARDTARWLERALRDLPLPQREVVMLCCVEQMPQRTVADVLEMPVNTVKTHLRRARLALAKGLARRRRRLVRETSR